MIASDPTCDIENVTVMENNHIRLQCNVIYGGLWRPVMEWTPHCLHGQENTYNDSIFTNVAESQQYISMTVSLQILAKPHHNGSSFVCNTYFDRADMLVKHTVNNNTRITITLGNRPKLAFSVSLIC